MSDVVIRVENVSKEYRLGVIGHGTLSKDLQSRWARFQGKEDPNVKIDHSAFGSDTNERFWALKDISFDVHRGEVVGIIGRNGAGKSTLLKILSRVTTPTTGSVKVKGRIASLLEVGTGFHPELTGRENVFLNGAILGMTRREVEEKFDEIVGFAEIEKFIDTPVKRYSSGMYVRLAFAVAAHLEPEILLVDEVLAVGDVSFQKKCLGKMGDVAKEGRTVLFVSHNMAAVKELCPSSLLLDRGELVFISKTDLVIDHYLENGVKNEESFSISGRIIEPNKARILNAWFEKEGKSVSSILFGDELSLIILIDVFESTIFSVELILRQYNRFPVAFAPSGLAFDWEIHGKEGLLTVRAKLPPAKYAAGRYFIDIILAETGFGFLDYIESAISFHIDSVAIGKRNWNFSQNRGQGYSLWNVEFQIGA